MSWRYSKTHFHEFRVPIPSGEALVRASCLRPRDIGAAEWHICVAVPSRDGDPPERDLRAAYASAQQRLGLPPQSAVMGRVFASDLGRTQHAFGESPLLSPPAALSVVEQPPLPDGGLSLWAYHVSDGRLEKRPLASGVQLRRGRLRHLWTVGLTATRTAGGARAQTRDLFSAYCRWLETAGASLSRDVVRTWVYVADIDADYAAMVDARRELFATHGLAPDTHTIASTGIAGRCGLVPARVGLDAYAVAGLRPEQIRFLSAPSHLGPAAAYGSTFERGAEIRYGDRRHVVISGTASISPTGAVLFEGDAAGQADRALDNVEALLRTAPARLDDVAVAIVYLRSPTDYELVRSRVEARLPGSPTVFVHAPVCRPQWLVEIECLAIQGSGDPRFAAF